MMQANAPEVSLGRTAREANNVGTAQAAIIRGLPQDLLRFAIGGIHRGVLYQPRHKVHPEHRRVLRQRPRQLHHILHLDRQISTVSH